MVTTRREFLRSAGCALGACAFSAWAGESAARRPNILFIFADDLASDGIGALGNPQVQTPNIDRLVRSGTAFTRAYIQGAWLGAVCVASRTMLMTGRNVWDAKSATMLREAQAGRLWPQLMQGAGYSTSYSGKWHVPGIKPDAVFETVLRERPGMPKDTPEAYDRPQEGKPDPWSPSDPAFGGYWAGGKHWSEVQGDDGVDLIEKAAKQDKPFFIYLPFNAPHDPRQSPREYLDRYPLESIKVPENCRPDHPHRDEMNVPAKLRDEHLAPIPRTDLAIKTHRKEYYALISHFDAQVGRILEALEKSGQADNTLIIFSADNGLAVGRHGLFGKQSMYDHSVTVPLVLVGPGVPKGQRREAPVYMHDVMATCLDLAGVSAPKHVAYRSLLPLLHDEKSRSREYLYSCYMDGQRMVTDEQFKLILYPKVPQAMLFDLKADPLEMQDLSKDPAQKCTMKRLFAAFLKLQKELGDTLDVAARFPELMA